MGILIVLVLLGSLYIGAKLMWKTGFLAGRDHEALMWLASIDKLFVPNWQCLPINDPTLTPEESKFANQVYSAAYRAALDHIKLDIAADRREVVEKFKAKQEERSYPV